MASFLSFLLLLIRLCVSLYEGITVVLRSSLYMGNLTLLPNRGETELAVRVRKQKVEKKVKKVTKGKERKMQRSAKNRKISRGFAVEISKRFERSRGWVPRNREIFERKGGWRFLYLSESSQSELLNCETFQISYCKASENTRFRSLNDSSILFCSVTVSNCLAFGF